MEDSLTEFVGSRFQYTVPPGDAGFMAAQAELFRLPEYWTDTCLVPGDVLQATLERGSWGEIVWHWEILRQGRAEAHGQAVVA